METIIAIVVGILAIVGAVFGAFLKGQSSGKTEAQNEALKQGAQERNEFDDRIQAGHAAGNQLPSGGVPNDPNDRAYQRKSRKSGV